MKRLIRSLLHSLGYDVIPYPINDWFEQKITLGRHLMELFSRYQINCVLDVGAHYGEYGTFLREAGYTGKIISFEPVKETFQRLQRLSVKDGNWDIHNFALGAANTGMDIQVFRDSELSSFLTPNDYCASHMGKTDLVAYTERVEVRTLDSVFDSCVVGIAEPRVYLKLDTQGYDLTILEHALGHLNQIQGLQSELSLKPIYEVMPSYLDALPKLRELGFEVTGLFPVSRDRKLRLIEVDCVMIRERVPGQEAPARVSSTGVLAAVEGGPEPK